MHSGLTLPKAAACKALTLMILLALASCATQPKVSQPGRYKVGTPYQIAGVWYYPKEDPFYDETGVASWYGPDFHGKSTANGERYDMETMTAAHRTLPMPSIVRVTNLENGKSLRLRVNDRGPYARGRILDVSRRAAELLGFIGRGTARVRVQYEGRGDIGGAPAVSTEDQATSTVSVRGAPLGAVASTELAPPEGATGVAPPAPTAPPAVVATAAADPDAAHEPDGTVTTVAVPTITQLWVQVGAFVSRGNADRLSQRLARLGNAQVSRVLQNGKAVFRVRFGPFKAVEDADMMLDKVIGTGQNGAQIVVE